MNGRRLDLANPIRRAAHGGLLSVLAASIAVTGTAETTSAAQDSAMHRALNIAHRGASAYAPEHTFPAWDLALEMGADYIEQDLQMTADGILVVLHDEKLDRTARGDTNDCSGLVADKHLAQIKTCDVGSWFNDEHPGRSRDAYVGLRIPTLEEVLDRYPEASFYIETKNPEESPGIEEELLRLLERFGLARGTGTDRVIIQSFSPASLLKMRQLNAELRLVQLVPERESSASMQPRLAEVASYAFGIGPHHTDVDVELLDAAHQAGLHVHPYTVDDVADLQSLLALGVDGIFTNRPDRLRSLAAGRSKEVS